MDKYYTPELEEFHLGFLVEVPDKKHVYEELGKKQERRWMFNEEYSPKFDKFVQKEVDGQMLSFYGLNPHHIPIDMIRVKYLDAGDIKSEGWIVSDNDTLKKRNAVNFIYEYTDPLHGKLLLIHDKYSHSITIKHPNYIRDGSGNFDGFDCIVYRIRCKNKGELRKLMKQLNINV